MNRLHLYAVEMKLHTSETWLTRPRFPRAFDLSCLLLAAVVLSSFLFLNGVLGADQWMGASREAVFGRGELWRLFTSLFAHGDLGHLLSNAALLFPFSFFLLRHFPRWFFPGLALLSGAVVNALVLLTMPPEAQLIGISGVVYWMGSAWLTLYLLIERREPLRRRWGKFIILTAALFIPETIRPEVSYLSHFLGFLLGVVAGLAFYRGARNTLKRAEKQELLLQPDVIEEGEWNSTGVSPPT